MAIKLIVMDLDGTLLDDDHVTVPERNIRALRAASQRGVKLAIASGRTWSLLAGATEQLGLMDYALVGNGAAVRDIHHRCRIYERGIPNPQALELIDLLRREDIPFEVYAGGQNYVQARDKERVHAINLTPEFADFFDSVCLFPADVKEALAGRAAEKFNLFYVPADKRETLTAQAAGTGPLAISQALEDNMEFNAVGVNKGTALQALCAHLGLTADEVMAFGDAGNDLEMLRWAHWSFAMDSGTREAKEAARFIAPVNSQAGVGQMVEQYVLSL